MVDVVVLSVWVWLMGGFALAVPAVYAWVVMAAALGLGPKAAARFTLLSLAAVAALGAAHRFFDTVVFESQRQILLNLVLSAALLVPLGLLLYVIGKVQRDAETVAAQARLRLAELREMRDEFLSSVSFEMRTPLTSVKGFTATLLDSWDSLSDDERLRFLQIVNRQSDRLARLISAMVDFAQLDSGTLRLVLESINVSDLLGQVMTRTLRMHEDASQRRPGCDLHPVVAGDRGPAEPGGRCDHPFASAPRLPRRGGVGATRPAGAWRAHPPAGLGRWSPRGRGCRRGDRGSPRRARARTRSRRSARRRGRRRAGRADRPAGR